MKLHLIYRAILLLTVFATFGISTLSAQNVVGGVRGLIQDPGGAIIAGANVTLTNQGTNVSRSTVSNAQGEYVFSQVEPGTYSISVEAQGFKKLQRPGVIVSTQEFLTIDLKMEIGEVSQSISVTTEVPLIENSNASNGQVLDSQKLTDLPNLGRNPFLMSKLSTNVVTAGDPRFNRFQDQIGSSAISVAGGPIRGNNYLIDGIPVTSSQNLAVIIPSLESVQEVKMQVGTYDATMGRTGGGVFNTLLKTGSNDFHGDAFGYLRETGWSANNFFLNASGTPRQPTNFKTWGAAFGGPILIPKIYNGKNRTFFWVATEAYRQHSPLSDSWAVPTALEKAGNYSQSSTLIFDPLSTRACAPSDNCPAGVSTVRDPFPGNIIPASRINTVGRNILSYMPLPNSPGPTDSFNYIGNDSLFDRADEYTYKAEHSVTNWLRLTGSFLYYKSREPGGNTLGTPAGGSSNSPYLLYRKVDATAVNVIMTPNPTTVVTVRYGFNRFPNIYSEISAGFNPGTLGFSPSYVNSLQQLYFPEIDLNSNSISAATPSNTVYWSKNANGSVSKFIGRHSVTMGIDYRLIHTDGISWASGAGDFSFNGVFSRQFPDQGNGTGADFADLLMGYPYGGSVQTTTKLYDYVRYFGGYVQDDIRVNSRLTVNVGLRYEYETGVTERNDALVVGFNQTQINPVEAYLPAGSGVVPYGVLEFAGQNGNPNSCCNPSKTQFGPRLGMAYQLTPKTTLRAGYGIFYAPDVFSGDPSFAPGYSTTTNYVASHDGFGTPANSLSNPFPQGVGQPVGNTQGPFTQIGNQIQYLSQSQSSGIVHQFSVDLQQALPFGIAFEVGYIGSRSNHLLSSPGGGGFNGANYGPLYINQVPTQYLLLGSALNNNVANPFYGTPAAQGVLNSPQVPLAQLLSPFPEYTTVLESNNTSNAQYDSLVLKGQKRLSKGITFLATLTWSKNEDNEFGAGSSNALNGFAGSTPPSAPQNYYNLGAEWALSSVNVPLRVTLAWTYQLPFGKGRRFLNSNRFLDLAVGGWEINGVAILQEGFPLFVFQQNLNSVIGTNEQRPNTTGLSPSVSGSLESKMYNYINPAAFSLAPEFTFGDVSRDISYRGPGQANWDVSLFKNFTVKERFTGQFRAEALNVFNTPYFAQPNTQYIPGSNNTFGEIGYQANLPRELQLGLRFFF